MILKFETGRQYFSKQLFLNFFRIKIRRLYLLVHTHSIQAMVHDVDPSVLGGEHKQGHQSLEKKKERKKEC